jgi:type I restriction enzyme M protein
MPFEIAYGDDPFGESPRIDEGKNGRWRCLNREELEKQEERLDYCWLQSQKPLHPAHSDDIWQVLESTVEELEAIKVILEK